MSVRWRFLEKARLTGVPTVNPSSVNPKLKGELLMHASDEDLVAFFYTGELGSSHVTGCSTCQQRLSVLLVNRESIERDQMASLDVCSERLISQRRQIYARLSYPVSFWSQFRVSRWISASAAAMILGGGLLVIQHQQAVHFPQRMHVEDKISDADLAQEVSSLSQNVEAMPAQPLKGLFE